jgi:hypothetical protein
MIKLIGVHRTDEAHVIDNLPEMREDIGDFGPALPVPRKVKPRSEHGGIGFPSNSASLGL